MLYQKFNADRPEESAYSKIGLGREESVGKIHASIVRLETLRLDEPGTVTRLVVPSKLIADPTSPGPKAIPVVCEALLPLTISETFLSPGHHATSPLGAGAHVGAAPTVSLAAELGTDPTELETITE